MDSVPQKRCTKCGEYYPSTLEYFKVEHRNRNGLTAQCINCIRAYGRERYQRPAVKARAKELQSTPEYKAKASEYYHIPEVKERILSRMKQPEAQRRAKELNKTPERRKQRKIYKQGEHNAEYDKQYRQRPYVKELNKTKQARRRARKMSLPCDFTSEQWFRSLDYFEHKCAVCGRPAGLWHVLGQDHWIPLASSDCPGTIATNIIPLCDGLGGCNRTKHMKPAEQWLIEQFGKRKAKEILVRINAYFEWVKAA